MRYNQHLHTPEARESQLAAISERHPQILIVGSVGRAAVLGASLSTSKGRLRPETRDIDLTSTDGGLVPLTDEDNYPFPVDNALRQLIRSSVAEPYATVVFSPDRTDVSVELPSIVFEPYQTKVGSIAINTFHPDTLRRLHLICNSRRPKDVASIAGFDRALIDTDYQRLPDRYYAPLYELQHMVMNDPELRLKYRNERILTLYGTYIPAPIRALMRPIARPLRKAVGIFDRGESELSQVLPLPHQQ